MHSLPSANLAANQSLVPERNMVLYLEPPCNPQNQSSDQRSFAQSHVQLDNGNGTTQVEVPGDRGNALPDGNMVGPNVVQEEKGVEQIEQVIHLDAQKVKGKEQELFEVKEGKKGKIKKSKGKDGKESTKDKRRAFTTLTIH